MFTDFQHIDFFPTSAGDILANFIVATLCGLFISFVYRKTYKGPGYAISFVHSMILLTVITAMVIMIIGNSLARAFGLVGAMSIIRFRTAVKETFDIVFIFFALAAGLAAGAGSIMIAITGTLFVGTIVYLLSHSTSFAGNRKEYLLQFSALSNGTGVPPYSEIIQRYCRQHRVVNVKSTGESAPMELSYYVQFKDSEKNQEFLTALKSIPGVRQINLYFDDEQF
jgi:uncharacterized membrane protein YhiD involved in acid resistance